MKIFLLVFLAALTLKADGLSLFLHTRGQTADGPPVGGLYSFPDAEVGTGSTVVLRLKNTSTTEVYLVREVSTSGAPFFLDGSILDTCLASGAFEDLLVSFAPAATGAFTSPITMGYAAYPASTGCPSSAPQNVGLNTLTTLNGNGLPATLSASLALDSGNNALFSQQRITFGQIPVGSSQTATITVQNVSAAALPLPQPAIVSAVFAQSPFALGSLANWPATLAPGASASFPVIFTPTQQVLVTATLTLGPRTYPLTGTGIPGEGLSSLLVSYTLPSGVHYTISPASPMNLGAALTGSSGTFIFTVSNPATNYDSQSISSIAISGSGFSLAGLPPLPAVVSPGNNVSFSIVFAPKQAGTASASLSIGTLKYSLTGAVSAPSLNPSFNFSPQMLASAQQGQLSLSLPNPAPAASIGTLMASFSSSVSGVSDDPAIQFISTGGRSTNVTFAAGSATGTFPDGSSSVTFQTGTTAGTLTFTLSFATGESYTKSVDITPQTIQIQSASAIRQSPDVVINVSAFDNTYSATKVVFNFYGSNGASLTPGGITYDGTSAFHNYFFTNNQAGGAFNLQAQFPVTGDITTIAAADVTIQNSSGQSQTQHLTF